MIKEIFGPFTLNIVRFKSAFEMTVISCVILCIAQKHTLNKYIIDHTALDNNIQTYKIKIKYVWSRPWKLLMLLTEQ